MHTIIGVIVFSLIIEKIFDLNLTWNKRFLFWVILLCSVTCISYYGFGVLLIN